MLRGAWRNFHEEVLAPEGAQQFAPRLGRTWFVDTLIIAALIAAIVLAATWVMQPRLRTQAEANDSNRVLVGFWPAEQNGADTFRWSRTDAAVRLFGFEQQAPVALRLRLTAVRQPKCAGRALRSLPRRGADRWLCTT